MKWDKIKISIKRTNFKDPVYVEMISGKVYEINKSDVKNHGADVVFKSLPVWDSPILITERTHVPIGIVPDKK